jgi:anaerobic selenocysteine-containing dehydrogenase
MAGLANKADVWLCVRPGTDAALALWIRRAAFQGARQPVGIAPS